MLFIPQTSSHFCPFDKLAVNINFIPLFHIVSDFKIKFWVKCNCSLLSFYDLGSGKKSGDVEEVHH